jgi:hypothetical protein
MGIRVLLWVCTVATILCFGSNDASALSKERWTNGDLYGVFFNDYEPNFYTGFVPRVQDGKRVQIHLGRGNQLRIRVVLSDEAIESYLPDQVARHNLYQELIDKKIVKLTTNMAWENYHARVVAEKLEELVGKRPDLDIQAWGTLNLEYMDKLMPGRLFHIQKDFNKMVEDFSGMLRGSETPDTLEAKLDLINEFFPHRIFLNDLNAEQDAAFKELVALAKTGDMAAFRLKA